MSTVLTLAALVAVVLVVIAVDHVHHRRWLEEIGRSQGPASAVVAEAQFAAGAGDRRPLRWFLHLGRWLRRGFRSATASPR